MWELLSKFGESILSKLGEKVVEVAFSQEDRATNESLQRNIKSLSAKAKDVSEQINMAELCSKKKRKRVVEDWLDQVQLIQCEFRNLEIEMQSEGFMRRFFGWGRAKKLDSSVRELYEISRDFGDQLMIDCNDVKDEKFLTGGLVGEEFEKNLKVIMELLLVDKVSSIGIYGMGGVGKTTLVKHVNNRLIEQTEEHVKVVWITVSQEFTIPILQDKIGEALGLTPFDERDEDKKASKLNRMLSDRKNLIIIFDDVWERMDFKKLGDPLSTNGCRLLITTRLKKVCDQLDCKKVIKVQTLKENEAWNLFNEALGQDTDVSHVEETAKSLVKLCDGLPLGIITLAGSMKGESDIRVWRDALAKLRRSIMGLEEQVFNVLKYSFDRLDQNKGANLQQCFLCCSLFPEDESIPRYYLIELFMLEDFLDKRDGRKASFDQGHAILDQLVNVSLLERVDRDYEKMHDLVRAMALKITEGTAKVIAGTRSMIEIPNDGEWTKELEKMSLMMNQIHIIPDGMSPDCPKLSTLILHHNYFKVIPKSFFSHMCSLSILDLSRTLIDKLPDEVSDMERLKALNLDCCTRLVYVPSLGKLKKLRKLELSRTAIKEVPQGMEELINLQFLGLGKIYTLKTLLSNFVLNFRRLQCLFLPLHAHVQVEELVELKYLEEFRGRVRKFNEFFHLIRSKKYLAYRIVVQPLDGPQPFFYPDHGSDYNELRLIECDLKKLKDEEVNVLDLGILRHLYLMRCEGSSDSLIEDVGRLINPTFLEGLSITACEGIESISRRKQFRGVASPVGSTSISTSPPIVQTVFTSLTVLYIRSCKNIKSLGISVFELPNLDCIVIHDCKQMEEIFEENERGQGGQLQDVSLSKLRRIELCRLPKLKSICDATIVCVSLSSFRIQGCASLKRFPVIFGQPNYDSPPLHMTDILLRLKEKEWWEKLELGHPIHHSLLQPFIRWV